MRDLPGPILLTGTSGQVGGALLPLLAASGVEVVAPGREALDLTDPASIRSLIAKVQPRWIINPAAYTAVDKAETDREAAFAINCEAVRTMGEEAARIGAGVLHFSTDYVFSGEGEAPWSEDDTPAPQGVYGASKLAGEQALAATGAAHVILRTSWVYGATGKNFLKTILLFAREREELRIVSDQHGAPTWSGDLARWATEILRRTETAAEQAGASLESAVQPVSGVYHACDAGETTWYGFASAFLQLAREQDPAQPLARLVPIRTEDYPTPAARPKNSRMRCDKLRRVFGITPPPWQESTRAVMAELEPLG